MRIIARGTGSYLPEKILTNHDLSTMVDTNHDWIVERTGIHKRHIAAEDELTSDMALNAATKALEAANISAADIDLIILATTTPDNTFPSTACKLQGKMGAQKAAAFDIQAVCGGYVYALSTAHHFAQSGQYKHILVVGAEKLSNIVDWKDRGTCILFGDGAGAIVFEAVEDSKADDRGVLSTHLHSDGSKHDILYVDGGVGLSQTAGHIHMDGQEVFKHAVTKLSAVTKEALDYNQLSAEQIDWIIPHQANIRILDAVAKRMKLPKEKLIATVQDHANTSAASIPLAVDSAVRSGKVQAGQLIAVQAIGGGLTWGSALIRW